MAFKPMFALHKDNAGNVLTASSFKYDHNMGPWLRDLDIRAGDSIEFHEAAERPEFDEVEPFTPAFIETPPAAPPTEKPILADDPF